MAPSPTNQRAIAEVADHLRQCRRLLFITGAGLSADSNLPTYRGIGGLYERNETEEGMPIEELLSGEMLLARPELTWKYLTQVEMACRDAVCNRGHEVIALLQDHVPEVWVLTQNVDGFHREAGSRNVIDIHGDLHDLICTRCSYRERVRDYAHLKVPPSCPDCGGLVRPDVVLFGELLPDAKTALMRRVLFEGANLVFSVGTSSLFPYIVEPVLEAKRWGVPTVEINPGHTDISNMVDFRIKARAAESLDAIWRAFRAS